MREKERERSLERTSRTEKEGGIEDETEREVCHKANRESEAIFALFFAKPKNERVSDRLTAPILFTASCQILSASILALLFFAISRGYARSYSHPILDPRPLWFSFAIDKSISRKGILYLTSNKIFERSATFSLCPFASRKRNAD